MGYYFHKVFGAKQAFHLLKLNTTYIHFFIIRSIYKQSILISSVYILMAV